MLHILWAWTMTGINHCGVLPFFHCPKILLCSGYSYSPPPLANNHWSFYCLHKLAFSKMFSCNFTVCSLSRLSSFHIVICIWSPPHVFSGTDCSFLVLNNIPSFGCTTVYFIYSSIHLVCFKVLKIMTKTAINICVESVALCIHGSVYQPLCF